MDREEIIKKIDDVTSNTDCRASDIDGYLTDLFIAELEKARKDEREKVAKMYLTEVINNTKETDNAVPN